MNIHSDLIISRADGRPMYLQIIEQIKQRIALGDWPAGSEIPSIRQLAIDLRISVITVKRAYFELEHEGIIVTQHGKGSFVATNTQLSRQVWEDELNSYLEQVARLAALLGLSNEQLIQRLHAAASHQQQELL